MRSMRRSVGSVRPLLAIVAALCVPAHAAAQQSATEAILWHGPWYLGMTSGVADLSITGNVGTLTLTNNESFGAEPVAVSDLERDYARLHFRALGADGKTLSCQIPVSADGAKARGFCRYAGFNLRFELNRVSPLQDKR
jgi:hypothetical protein